jgi:ubiquinone/menaquinone biosynthesis C-methylase UbiE
MKRLTPSTGPDRAAALEQYRHRAAVYDWELAPFEPLRRDAIAALALRPGEVVIDVGCGTGLSLRGLHDAVGPRGRVIGIEQSPEMIGLARRRVAAHGWRRITLLEAPVEMADIAAHADAALFHFTHDIQQTPAALANVLSHLKPGARVIASGLKWADNGPAWATNLFVLAGALRSVSSLAGLGAPWALLQQQLGPLHVEPRLLGAAYLARGIVARA